MYFTGNPEVALKTAMGACCSSCAKRPGLGETPVPANIVAVGALIGITWLVVKSMKRVAR